MNEFRLIVGLRLDKAEYYLGFDRASANASDYRSVRGMLSDHLEELEGQATALRSVLATRDPEEAEHVLQDGLRLQVSEVILRPRIAASTYLPRLREGGVDALLDDMRRAGDGAA